MGASDCSARSAFSAPTISGAVSSKVPSRSNNTAASAMSGGTFEVRKIVDVGVRREGKRAGKWVVCDTGQIGESQPRLAAPTGQFRGADEFQILVRTSGQHAGDVFRAEN